MIVTMLEVYGHGTLMGMLVDGIQYVVAAHVGFSIFAPNCQTTPSKLGSEADP